MDNIPKNILVTGCAGFIGSKISEMLLERGANVIGVDNLNNSYIQQLKDWRLSRLMQLPNFQFNKIDITDFEMVKTLFESYDLNAVINLAAKAGVRSSLDNPWIYIETNVTGTLNLLELCRRFGVKKFVLSSSSSVYGKSNLPFNEDSQTDFQLSPYASSKKSAESLAFTYHYLYGIDTTILRYFTVYGPAGRPDMTPFKFTHCISKGIPINVFGDGTQERDFTYIDDIARGSINALKSLGFEIINLGSDHPIKLKYLIQLIENNLGNKAKIEYQPNHPADISSTWADISKAKRILGWQPQVSVEEGIQNTVNWYLENKSWLNDLYIE